MIIVIPTSCSFDLFALIRSLCTGSKMFPIADLCLGGSGGPQSDDLYCLSHKSIVVTAATTNQAGGEDRLARGLGYL